MVLSNRELAVVIWASLFFAWALSKRAVRQSAVRVVRAAVRWQVVSWVAGAAVYVAVLTFALGRIGMWTTSDVKETILWGFTSGLAMMFEIASRPAIKNFFRDAVLDGIKISVVLEFLLEAYQFSLPVELALVPGISLLSLVLLYSKRDRQYRAVTRLLDGLLLAIGSWLLCVVLYRAWRDWSHLANTETIVELALPILLTVLFIPFVYFFAVVVSFQDLAIRLRWIIRDEDLRRFTMRRLALRFGYNLGGIRRWSRKAAFFSLKSQEDVLASFRNQDVGSEPAA